MAENFLVTVIMSCYNQEKYIEQSIKSVLEQNTSFSVQLLITDDHSTKDKSVEIIRKYEKKYYPKIVAIYNSENGGYLKNIIRAKKITKTKYFCLLDADDFWTDMNYLQDAVDYLESHDDYVIYSRNVVCKHEDDSEHLFIPKKVPISDYCLDDYFQNKIHISQTTGSFFRNVIFSVGIPEIMEKSIGTISERSFEGDFDRYLMHLKYGRAHYDPKPSGVYRMLSSGIWSKLDAFDKNLIQAQTYLDYNEYFEGKYNTFFLNKSYEYFNLSLDLIISMNYSGNFSKQIKEIFFNALNIYYENKRLISHKRNKKLKNIYLFLLRIYKFFV